ncbi:MAG: N-acetyltransferase [Vallitaleaceae bacterium]|nr:N-acetyltransferase [Vallitaleaceae bacterium]
MLNYQIIPMLESHWPNVKKIYKEGMITGIATFQNDLPTWDEWNQEHCNSCRFVIEEDHQILGWAALTPTSNRCIFAGVAEVSIYISPQHQGKSLGTELLMKLIAESEVSGYWTLQAGILRENIGSYKLHLKCGFREVGYREKIGQTSDGLWHDMILMERRSNNLFLPLT